MLRGLFILLILILASANQAFSQGVQNLPPLPNGATAYAVQLDSAGNIYVAGISLAVPQPSGPIVHAVVGKLSPDGAKVIWWTELAGSMSDSASALALGADNSVYVAGSTTSPDFPTTPGSLQPKMGSSNTQAFAVKLDPTGKVVYSTYLGGSASTVSYAIVVDSQGDAFITGSEQGAIPTPPGAVAGSTSPQFSGGFVIKLNPAGSSAPVAINGLGGNAIALDAAGNIYAAGNFVDGLAPTTPGAFQSSAPSTVDCFSTFISVSYCGFQHIAKIDPTGTRLLYGTYLAGSRGATPSAIVVDSAGNVIVAGTTNSPDYPTTPSAYQPEFFSNPSDGFDPPFERGAPALAGYVTKLNAAGSALIWSTLLAGSSTQHSFNSFFSGIPSGDSITAMGLDSSGNILLAGVAQSADFPGLWSTPVASRPTSNGEDFVARLSSDGTTLSPTQLVPVSSLLVGLTVRADGSALVVPSLSTVTIGSLGRVAAICDTADAAKIVRIAPGQLLTLYGTALGPAVDTELVTNQIQTTLNGVTVTFNGIAAPILYTSSIQVNLQVPYEVAGLTQVTMQVSSTMVSPMISESYTLEVVDRQPSVFIAGSAFSQPMFDVSPCNEQNVSGIQPLAFNSDGTQNSCANPAATGTNVTIFLNGLGVTSPSQSTGVINDSVIALTPTAGIVNLASGGTTPFPTSTIPGSIDSLAQVQIPVSVTTITGSTIPLVIQQPPNNANWVRGPGLIIWVQQ